jgi:hypothetical protein
VAENPEPKLTPPLPLGIVMTEVAVPLALKPVAVAMASTVVVALTGNGAVYNVDDVDGVVPFRV